MKRENQVTFFYCDPSPEQKERGAFSIGDIEHLPGRNKILVRDRGGVIPPLRVLKKRKAAKSFEQAKPSCP